MEQQPHSVSFVLTTIAVTLVCTIGVLLLIFFNTQPKIAANDAPKINNNWTTGDRASMVKHMAPRLGMTYDAMIKELASGKTMIQVISEHEKYWTASSSSASENSSATTSAQ